MTTATSIDTSTVTDRRTLRFNSLDEALADIENLAAADGAGHPRCVGNWTFGQILGHLATWIDYGFDGMPRKVPLIIRLMIRPMKRSAISKPMAAGRKIPNVPGGTLATEMLSSQEGTAKIKRSIARLKQSSPAIPHPLFGKLTHEQWINLHLRHCELHLSFCRENS